MDSEVLWSARVARKPDMRGFFGAVAVQALCFGAAWWFGLNPYFMGGLCVYAVLGWVWRWRIEWLARPLAVQLSERAVRVVRRRFWGGELRVGRIFRRGQLYGRQHIRRHGRAAHGSAACGFGRGADAGLAAGTAAGTEVLLAATPRACRRQPGSCRAARRNFGGKRFA